MPALFEGRSNVRVVVNLSVVCDPDRVVLVRQWLVAASEIDNAQTTMGEEGGAIRMKTGAIRPAMGEDITHTESRRDVIVNKAVGRDNAGDSTHGSSVEQAACHRMSRKTASVCSPALCSVEWKRSGEKRKTPTLTLRQPV
jgi:hypothetical protein